MEQSKKDILANMKQPQKIMISLIASFVLASIIIYFISNPDLPIGHNYLEGVLTPLLFIGAIILLVSLIVTQFKINTMVDTLHKIEAHLAFQNKEIRKQKSVISEPFS